MQSLAEKFIIKKNFSSNLVRLFSIKNNAKFSSSSNVYSVNFSRLKIIKPNLCHPKNNFLLNKKLNYSTSIESKIPKTNVSFLFYLFFLSY